jgi:hypothetical protein
MALRRWRGAFVGKAFIGPFKAVAVDRVAVQDDGTAYITLRDENENVLGLVADRAVLCLMLSQATIDEAQASSRRSMPLLNAAL